MGTRWFTVVEFLVVLIVSAIIAFGLYFLFTRDDDEIALSPTPTVNTENTPAEYVAPTPLPSFATPPPQPTSIPTLRPTSNVSGISGRMTITRCQNQNCTVSAMTNIAVSIKDRNGNLISTIYSDTAGYFSARLSPGTYLVGPFTEPATGYTLAATNVIVNQGAYSDVQVTFRSGTQ